MITSNHVKSRTPQGWTRTVWRQSHDWSRKSRFKAMTPKVLYGIMLLGGTLLDLKRPCWFPSYNTCFCEETELLWQKSQTARLASGPNPFKPAAYCSLSSKDEWSCGRSSFPAWSWLSSRLYSLTSLLRKVWKNFIKLQNSHCYSLLQRLNCIW